MKYLYAFMITMAVLSISAEARATEITMTTYYPSPTGNYDHLSARELRLGNLKSGCSVKNEGAIRYNEAVKMMEYCNGQGWTALGSRTNCPDGYALIGTSGSGEAFCSSIQNEEEADFLSAAANCQAKHMHLCSPQEWVTMCLADSTGSFSGQSNWVFAPVYTGLSTAAMIMGGQSTGAKCQWSATDTDTKVPYRCCFQ